MKRNISVLVVDDSAFMRKILTDILESAGDIDVKATANNGVDALEKAKAGNFDVITLDVEMPYLDGISCLKELQKITDSHIIMLSSHTISGEKATIDALEAGAIDFITKPASLFDIAGEKKKKEIIEKVRMTRNIRKRVVKQSKAKPVPVLVNTEKENRRCEELRALIAIGTSTGGPKALQTVIPNIPGDIPAAVLVVQHMPAGFTRSLAERLNMLSSLVVKEAENNEVIKPGHVYIAPGDYHMEVHKNALNVLYIKLTQLPPVGGHRPSVDVMMNSIASTNFPNVIGIIMTGMGSDGSEGVTNIKNKNKGIIISQDGKSCIVNGMPQSAINTGVVDEVVPLKKIAEVIVKYLGVDQ